MTRGMVDGQESDGAETGENPVRSRHCDPAEAAPGRSGEPDLPPDVVRERGRVIPRRFEWVLAVCSGHGTAEIGLRSLP